MDNSNQPAQGQDNSPTPEIRSRSAPGTVSIPKFQGDDRTPIKHILIGTPQIVAFTTRRLEQAGYAQVNDWAMPLKLNEPLNLVPDPGDVISLLVRYLRLQ